MALIGSLVSGVSAMQSFVRGMEVIGDNIANSKTVGFKRQRVSYANNFSDTLRDAAPGTATSSNQPPVQVGAGVNVANSQKLMQQGAIELTGVATDMAISGSGFFRVLNASSEEQFLTRDGSFRLDENGFLTDKNGNFLLGLVGGSPTDEPGVIGRLQVDLASDIKVDDNGRPLDGSGRIVLQDGTRAISNADSDTGFYRVDSTGRLIDVQNGNIILGDLDNNITTTEFAQFDSVTGKFILVNDSGQLIDAFGAELGGFNPRETAPTGASSPSEGILFNAFNLAAGATYQINADGNYVDSNGDDLGVAFDPNVAPQPVGPSDGTFVVYNRADSAFYLVNQDGNYVDATGEELLDGSSSPVSFEPDSTPLGITAQPPAQGSVFNIYNPADQEFYQVNANGKYVDSTGVELDENYNPLVSPTVPAVNPVPGNSFAAWSEADDQFYLVAAGGEYVDSRGLSLEINFDPVTSPTFNGVTPTDVITNVYNSSDDQFYQINENGYYVDANGNSTGIVFDSGVPQASSPSYQWNTADQAFYLVNPAGNYVDANGADLEEAFVAGTSPTTASTVSPTSSHSFFVQNTVDSTLYEVNGLGQYLGTDGSVLDGDLTTPGVINPITFDPTVAFSQTGNFITNNDGTRYVVNVGGEYLDSNGNAILDSGNNPIVAAIGDDLTSIPGTADISGSVVEAIANTADSNNYAVNNLGQYIDSSGNPILDGANNPIVATATDDITSVGGVGNEVDITASAVTIPNVINNTTDSNTYAINASGQYIDLTGAAIQDSEANAIVAAVDDDTASVATTPIDISSSVVSIPSTVSPVGGSIGSAQTPVSNSVFNVYNTADAQFYRVNATGDYVDDNGFLLSGVEWDPEAQALANPGSVAALFAEYNPDSPAAGTPRVALPSINDANQFKLAIQSWTINNDGELALALNDGTSYVRGQVLLQQVQDEAALVVEGSGLYSGFANAGAVGLSEWNLGGSVSVENRALHDPNQSGIGFIQARALEGSNTDLTQEFADMITTQRAFQAGSRVISVSDEMLQDIINLKR